MTRLDRARIALAYEYLRYRSRFDGDDEWKTVSYSEAWGMVDKSAGALPWLLCVVVVAELYVGDVRILRARLALYLRALLREDANDCGAVSLVPRDLCSCVSQRRFRILCDCWTFTRRIRPLWESAPAHRGTT